MLEFGLSLSRVQMPSRTSFPVCVSPERDLTEKSHKTSFKGHTKIACLSCTTSSSRLPPPTSLHSLPPLLLRFIHTSDGGERGTLAGGREWVHLQAVPLRGCEITSIWMGLSVAKGGGSSPQTAPAPCPHLSDLPHQLLPPGLPPHRVPSVPGGIPGSVLPLWVNLPARAPLIRASTPGGATGR